jgi:hypothetical protein
VKDGIVKRRNAFKILFGEPKTSMSGFTLLILNVIDKHVYCVLLALNSDQLCVLAMNFSFHKRRKILHQISCFHLLKKDCVPWSYVKGCECLTQLGDEIPLHMSDVGSYDYCTVILSYLPYTSLASFLLPHHN